MDHETGDYINRLEYFRDGNPMTEEERRKLIEKCIEEEYRRLRDALNGNDDNSSMIYSACVSLAGVCRWSHDKSRLHLVEESVRGAMLIKNKLVRLDALCIIAFYSDYNQIRANRERSLCEEIDYQLYDIYSKLSLLLHTTIFIRCLPLLREKETIEKYLQNLFIKYMHTDKRDRQVVYEALSPYLKSSLLSFPILIQTSNNCLYSNKSCVVIEYFDTNTDNYTMPCRFPVLIS